MTSVLQRFQENGDPFPQSALDAPAMVIPDVEEALWLRLLVPNVRPAVEAMHRGATVRGVAISLPQIDVNLRAFVYCPTGRRGEEQVFVNPEWTPIFEDVAGSTLESEEACLSVRGGTRAVVVKRYASILGSWLELERWWSHRPRLGARQTGQFHGFAARVWQHACDHLEGKIFGGCRVAAHFSGGCRG